MKKFVVSVSEYMGNQPHMYSTEAESVIDLIKNFMDIDDYDTDAEWAEDLGFMEDYSDDDVLVEWEENINGDGQPYVMIFDVEDDELVSG